MNSRIKIGVLLWACVIAMGAYARADATPASDPVVDIEQGLIGGGIDPPFNGSFTFTVLSTNGGCTSGTDPVSCNFFAPQFFNVGSPISEFDITIHTFDSATGGNMVDLNQEPWVANPASPFQLVSSSPIEATFATNGPPICTGDGQTTCAFNVDFMGVLIPASGRAEVTISAVPEPATAMLLVGSLPALWIRTRRRKPQISSRLGELAK